jgi:hypothetical protein
MGKFTYFITVIPGGSKSALPLCQLNVRITPASRHPRGISSGCPEATYAAQQTAVLFDHLVGPFPGEQYKRKLGHADDEMVIARQPLRSKASD